METTTGHLLDGRLFHEQSRTGHRTGIEPVFLAAAVPARSGERVLEAGTGSAAALMCLAYRIPGVSGVGVEREPDLAALARRNLAANYLGSLSIETGDITASSLLSGTFDHAFANPPWHEPAGTASPDQARERARRASSTLLLEWSRALASSVRARGTLTFVVVSSALPELLAEWSKIGLGSLAAYPLWPRVGVAAKLVLLQARRGGRTPFRLHAGIVVHQPDGTYTPEANAVLRGGAALSF